MIRNSIPFAINSVRLKIVLHTNTMTNLSSRSENWLSPSIPNDSSTSETCTHSSIPSPHGKPLSLTGSSDSRGCGQLIGRKRKSQSGGKLRKGHTKSTQGCLNCKKRRIKECLLQCQETQPSCHNCMRKNIECTYPDPKTLSALRMSATCSQTPIASLNLQGTPTIFSLNDMRLFHHFLLGAYPHIPISNNSTWVSQVPLIAHHNEYLMHAILGIAASHLELVTGMDLQTTAIYHRIHAIKGSNTAILTRRQTGSDADALLASCYLIAFQSSYIKDGLQEFFQTVRGCSILSNHLRAENIPMTFFLTEEDNFSFMEERLMNLSVLPGNLIEGAKNSLTAVLPLLDRPVNLLFYQVLFDVIKAAAISSVQVYFKFIAVYRFIIDLESQPFRDLIDPKNLGGRVLIAHFLAIQIVGAPIIDREWSGRIKSTPVRYHSDWIYSVCGMLPGDKKKFNDWPRAVADSVRDAIWY
ncbi:hypothetical protein DL98DRAFT_624687 [Cadophora sp. DSE1049]|nr:hypothetical protein DL98DRAFT_624687 [Cadophora sp. DSE1049]